MNAKIILAAIAAVCCVQGITAASLVHPLAWFENTDAATEFGLENVDLEQVNKGTFLSLETEQTRLDSSDKDKWWNIVPCVLSLGSVYSTVKEDKALYDEYKKEERNYKKAVAQCYEIHLQSNLLEKCLASLKTLYEERLDEMKPKLVRRAIKTVAVAVGLTRCFSMF